MGIWNNKQHKINSTVTQKVYSRKEKVIHHSSTKTKSGNNPNSGSFLFLFGQAKRKEKTSANKHQKNIAICQQQHNTTTPSNTKPPTGSELTCKGWIQEAALRMLLNNLNPDVAERPDDLIVYGGRGKAARNFEALQLIEVFPVGPVGY